MISAKNPRQLLLDIKLDESVSLENFIKCDSTKTALSILGNVVESSSISNSFLLWGRAGVGKNYLMQALNRDFLNQNLGLFIYTPPRCRALRAGKFWGKKGL